MNLFRKINMWVFFTGLLSAVAQGEVYRWGILGKSGIVVDRKTNLVWQQESGPELSFEGAREYCDKLRLGDLSWRVPTEEALFALVDRSKKFPVIADEFFVEGNKKFWTTTSSAEEPSSRWVLDFTTGENKTARVTEKYFVRCMSSDLQGRIRP